MILLKKIYNQRAFFLPTVFLLLLSCNAPNKEKNKDWSPNLDNLPKPFMQEHQGWIDLYNRAFEIAFLKVQHGTPENGFVAHYMDEAFSDKIFQWDTNFMMMFARYSNGELPSVVSLENFYMNQHSDGWIGRELLESDGSSLWPEDASGSIKAQCSINPPLFSWAEWQSFLVTGDADRFTKKIKGKTILQILVDYYFWIKKHRTWDNGLYWTTPFANGMDDSPRLFKNGVPSWDWSGDFSDICSNQNASWIDISAQQAMNAYYIAKIAQQIGDQAIADVFYKEHEALSVLINTMLWDEADGFYYDMDQFGALFKVKTPASFWTMVAHVSSPEQTSRLVNEHIINPNEFWTQHHLPTVAFNDALFKKDGGYWCGAIWAPTTYQTIKGLEEQGYNDLAHKVAYNHIQNVYWVYRNTNTLWENYQPLNNVQGSHARADFVGWTGCGPIANLIEHVMGIVVNAPENKIKWNLFLTEEYGIKNLCFGTNCVSLKCSDRSTKDKGVTLTVDSQENFLLIVDLNGETYEKEVLKGTNVFEIGSVETNLSFLSTQSISLKSLSFGNKDNASLMQIFKGTSASLLKALDVKIKRNGNLLVQSDLVVSLYEVERGVAKGPALATTKLPANAIDNFFEVVNVSLTFDGIKLGSDYAFILSQENAQKYDYSWIADENNTLWMKVYFGE